MRAVRAIDHQSVGAALHRLYLGAPEAGLRDEDRKKVDELGGLLREVAAVVERTSGRRPLTLVDAAAGKAYVGLLAAELVLAPRGRVGRIVSIEREPARVEACCRAAEHARAPGISFEVTQADVAQPEAWPDEPDLVVALHACGPASDLVIDQAVRARARNLLLVPCCTSKAVFAADLALSRADQLGLPRHAEVRRRFVQSLVDGERTLRLEAAGWETTVVAFVPPTVTPHNLMWRARRVGEPGRMAEAAANLRRLRSEHGVEGGNPPAR